MPSNRSPRGETDFLASFFVKERRGLLGRPQLYIITILLISLSRRYKLGPSMERCVQVLKGVSGSTGECGALAARPGADTPSWEKLLRIKDFQN